MVQKMMERKRREVGTSEPEQTDDVRPVSPELLAQMHSNIEYIDNRKKD